MGVADDLTDVLLDRPGTGAYGVNQRPEERRQAGVVGFRQGTVLAWDITTGENRIQLADSSVLQDLPALSGLEASAIKEGDLVGLLTWHESWFVLGRIRPVDPSGLESDSVLVGSIFSNNYERCGEGWAIDGSGTAEFSDLQVCGASGLLRLLSAAIPSITFFEQVDGDPTAVFGHIFGSRLAGNRRMTINGPPAPTQAQLNLIDIEGENRSEASLWGSTVRLQTDGSPETATITVGGQTGVIQIDAGVQTHIGLPSNGPVFIGHVTTGNPANCHITDLGQIMRSTSSARYKKNIQPAELDPNAIRSLEAVTFEVNNPIVGEEGKRFLGYVAEQVADIPGMEHFVGLDSEGKPESVHYPLLVVPLVELAKQQAARIEDLEQRLDSFETRLTAMEESSNG